MSKLYVGQSASMSKIFTEEDISDFAKVSGDYNPIHMDSEAAAKSRFGERIVHGMLSAGLISAVIGTKMPGDGAIYLEQTVKFLLPVYIGDEITANVEVAEIKNEEKGIYRLKTTCVNQKDEIVIDGEAVVKYV